MGKKTIPSFTLLELIIVMGLIGILALVIIQILKPQELFKKGKDAQRITDMQFNNSVIDIVKQESPTAYLGEAKKIYLSLVDASSTCGTWKNKLPRLPTGYSFACSANPEKADGTGWLPINFTETSMTKINALPVDPVNEPPNFYMYATDGKNYETAAFLDSSANRGETSISGKDSGISWNTNEIGSNLKLIPSVVLDGMGRDKNLMGYWTFDEGAGTTTLDYSGNDNVGILQNATWTDSGKSGSAMYFDGSGDYVKTISILPEIQAGSVSIAAWIKFDSDYNTNSPPMAVFSDSDAFSYNDVDLWFGTNAGGDSGNCTGANGKLSFRVYDAGGFPVCVKSSQSLWLANTWYFVAGVYSLNEGKSYGYINGVQYGSGTVTRGTTPYSVTAAIGSTMYIQNYFKGAIDDVRIYNRALSPTEIYNLYNINQ